MLPATTTSKTQSQLTSPRFIPDRSEMAAHQNAFKMSIRIRMLPSKWLKLPSLTCCFQVQRESCHYLRTWTTVSSACFQVAEVTHWQTGSVGSVSSASQEAGRYPRAQRRPSQPSRKHNSIDTVLAKSVVASPAPGQWLLTQLELTRLSRHAAVSTPSLLALFRWLPSEDKVFSAFS